MSRYDKLKMDVNVHFELSRILFIVMAVVDFCLLVGGNSIFFHQLYWFKGVSLLFGGRPISILWEKGKNGITDVVWWLRILMIGKTLLSVGLIRHLQMYHKGVNTQQYHLMNNRCRWMLMFVCWHILFTIVQVVTFFISLEPELSKIKIEIGPAPFVAAAGLAIEAGILFIVFSYFKHLKNWQNSV